MSSAKENLSKRNVTLTTEQKVKAAVFFIAFILIATWGFWPSASTIDKSDEIDALIDSRSFVKEKLLAPATADFSEDATTVIKTNDSTFSVNSFVDSENAFGAKLRSKYSCTIIYTHNNKVRCEDLIIL